jgi:prepilin-type N-terminal cleavage/methylation domain-containing protein
VQHSRGFTLIELMIVVAVIAVVVAIAVPSVVNARKSGNEASAVSSLRTLTTVVETYRSRFRSYPASLGDLLSANYIDDALGSGTKAGYAFSFTGTTNTWSCAADPVTPGITGERYFFVNQTGVIRFSSTGTATSTSTPID